MPQLRPDAAKLKKTKQKQNSLMLPGMNQLFLATKYYLGKTKKSVKQIEVAISGGMTSQLKVSRCH